MRFAFRWLRRLLTLIFIVGMTAGVLYFVQFTIVGIADEVEFRQEQSRRDSQRRITATSIAEQLQNESNLLASYTQFSQTDIDSNTPSEDVPSVEQNTTDSLESMSAPLLQSTTLLPTNTSTVFPSPTQTPSPTLTLTSTDKPTEVAQASPTLTPTFTRIPSNTPPPTRIPSNTPYPTDTALPTNTFTPSSSPSPTITFTPSATPTATITPRPTLIIEGTYVTPVSTPITNIPPRAPLAENDPNIINILLLGADRNGQTDVVIIVSVNKEASSVAMWHIPRDLLVYIPNYTIDRINVTFAQGDRWPTGELGLLKETILYNFGIAIDHYARVDFDDFRAIIAELGGLEVSVDCPIEDWRLKEEARDLAIGQTNGDDWEQYWEKFTLGIGVHTLDPYMALWYARSRVTTNDIDRGRRQMDVLRAMWYQARQQGLFTQVTTLWPRALEIVETDMTLEDVLRLVPIAMSIDLNSIERFSLKFNEHVTSWTTPDDGRDVLLPNYGAIYQLVRQFMTPPNQNRLQLDSKRIEVYDGTAYGLGWDRVAADRLAWEGFSPFTQGSSNVARHEVTLIYDYTGERKGAELQRVQEILRVGDSNVIQEPNPNRTFDYRIVVGTSYGQVACVYGSSADEVPDTPFDVEEGQ